MNKINSIDRAPLDTKAKVGIFFKHFVLVIWCITTLFPILWAIMSAFKENSQIYASVFALPHPIVWSNFPIVMQSINFPVTFTNSVIYSVVSVFVVIICSGMTAFYITKINKSAILLTFFTIGYMIPAQAVIIPLFIDLKNMNLLDSRLGIIIVYIVTNLSFSIFILAGFMKSISNEIIEAALIDGCKPISIFMKIILPISKPGIATVGTFVFMGVWNEFQFALVMLTSQSLQTLNLACYNLRGTYTSDQGLISAGVVVMIIPVIIIYMIFQEQVVKGLTAGAVKG